MSQKLGERPARPTLDQKVLIPLRHSLGGRILAGFLAMAFMSLVVALAAILYTSQSGNNLSSQVELDQQVTSAVLRQELAVERQFNAARGVLLGLVASDTDKEFNKSAGDYEQASAELSKIFDSLNISRKSANDVQELYRKFGDKIGELRAINLADFKITAIRTYENDVRQFKDSLISAIDADLKLYRDEINKKINASRDQGLLITILSLTLVLMTTIGGIIVAALITRSITRPLRELAAVADSIRKDNLDVEVPHTRGDDEVASLSDAMGRMAENLRTSRERLQSSLNETRRRNRELTAINRVAASVSSSLQLEQILNDALEELMMVSEMRHSSIFLMQPESETLRLVAYRNQNEAYLQHFGKGVKVGEQLTGSVAQSGEVVFVGDIDEDPRVADELRKHTGIKAYLGIPLTGSGKVVGVLNLTGEEQRTFIESDLELYRAIGSQVGIAVENAQLYSQAQLVAALEERNRLARDLHDSVTQTLFSITLTAESARAMLIKKPERVEPQLERLQNLARGALAEMRALIFQLRPAALEEQGLVSALVKHIEVVRSKENQNITFTVEGERRLSNEHEQALYRITQEALNNVVKHAQATEVDVKLTITEEAALLTITDNGVGFDTTAVSNRPPQEQKSLGMTSMRERAVLAGGNISINSNPGGGTTITVTLPLLSAPRPVGTGIN